LPDRRQIVRAALRHWTADVPGSRIDGDAAAGIVV